MSAVELLQELREAGVLLWVDGNKLRCKGPEEVLTAEALNNLREIKTEVLQLLTKKKKLSNHATGYGCGCGHNLYQQVEEFIEEPADDNWEHQYRLSKVWQCENCKAIYEFIGGSKGPVLIN